MLRKREFFSYLQLENMRTKFTAGCQVILLTPVKNTVRETCGFFFFFLFNPDDLEAQCQTHRDPLPVSLRVDGFGSALMMCEVMWRWNAAQGATAWFSTPGSFSSSCELEPFV